MANVSASVSLTSISAEVGDPVNVTVTPTITTVDVSSSAVSNTDIRAALSNVSPILYDNGTGVFSFDSAASFAGKTTDDLAEGNTNLYLNGVGTTSDLTEGTNLYYTVGRANTAIDNRIPDYIATNTVFLKDYRETVVDSGNVSGNVTLNLASGTIHKLRAVADITGLTLQAQADGSTVQIIIEQDAVGGHALDTSAGWDSYRFANDYTTLAQGGAENSVLTITHYDGVNYASLVTLDAPTALDNSALANSNVIVNGTTISLGGSGNISHFGSLTTDNLTEGSTNLYYSDSLVNTFLTVTGVTGNMIVNGNLDVAGNINYQNVVDLYVQDQKITLNANAATDATVEIIANRPVAGANTVLRWNETSDIWEFTNDGSTYYPIPTSTTDLAEGTNQYFTTARANSAMDAYLTSITANVDSVNGATGVVVLDTDDISEGTTNKYFSNTLARAAVSASGDLSYDQANGIFSVTTYKSSDFDTDFAAKTTDDLSEGTTNLYFSNTNLSTSSTTHLPEGTNLYYTTDRANTAIGAYQGDINTPGNITAEYFFATEEFIGDLEGAISEVVYNNTGGTLNKGKAVYVTGYQGSKPTVALADSGNASHMPAIGVVKQNISDATEGQVVSSGTMNFAAHGFTAGASLYINGNGDLTETKPLGESNLLQVIGKALGPNHILVQGAGRTNATPNLNDGNIFVGNASNEAVTADLSNFTYEITSSANIKTDGASLQSTGGIHGKADGSNNIGFTSYDTNILSSDTNHLIMSNAPFGESILNGTYTARLVTNKNDNHIKFVPTGTMVDGALKLVDLDLELEGANVGSIVNAVSMKNATNTVFEQPFAGNEYSDVATVDGDGFAFRNNNRYTQNLLTYTGSDPIVAHKVSGNIVNGSNQVVLSSIYRYYDDAVATIADISAGSYLSDGTNYGALVKGFPIYAYVDSVDTANNTIVMSESAQANISFTNSTVWHAMVDSTRNQVVALRSDYDNSGGSNTSLQFSAPIDPDAYGYPSTGFKASHFDTFSAGVVGDYTWDSANIAPFFVGRTAFTAEGTAPKYINGFVVGENTSLTSRGETDSLESFGAAIMWDGTSTAGYAEKISQILMKQYSNNTLQSTVPAAAGPRLFFTTARGQSTDYPFGSYPISNQELGRLTWWGTNGDSLAQSTVRPPAMISVQAANAWETQGSVAGNTNMFFAATSNHQVGADMFMAYQSGKLVLGAAGQTVDQAVTFAPTNVNSNTPQTAYAGNYHQWANVNYSNVAGQSGSLFNVTNGDTATAGDVGDLQLQIHRYDSTNGGGNVTPDNNFFVGYPNVYAGGTYPFQGGADMLLFGRADGSRPLPGLSDGDPITIDNYTGTFGSTVNGLIKYAKLSPFAGSFSADKAVLLFDDAGLTTPYASGSSTGYYGNGGTIEYFQASDITDYKFTWELPEQSETMSLSAQGNTLVQYSATRINIQDDVFLNLGSASNTEILAYTGMSNGDMVYNTTDSAVAVYAGGVWQNLQFSGNVT